MKEGITMDIIGNRISLKPIQLKHVYQMKNWGLHKNTLLFDYNLPSLTDEEIEEWYEYKTASIRRKYYSIFNEQNILIGYLGIKNIRRILREATLGIVLDPNYVNMGYGTEGIVTFLDYYFNKMNMRIMYLEVAKFNKRAIKCYEKSGFTVVDVYLDEFFNQSLNLKDPYYLNEKSSFVIDDGKIYNYIYKMKIDKKTYLKEREEIGTGKIRNKTWSIIK